MRKYLYFIIILLAVIIGYNYIYKNHRDIVNEEPEFKVAVSDLNNEFLNNSKQAELKYLNKTIEVSGNITEINRDNLTINDQVFCQFIEDIKTSLKIDSEITIKGRLIGYDDLLEQVKLDQCNISN